MVEHSNCQQFLSIPLVQKSNWTEMSWSQLQIPADCVHSGGSPLVETPTVSGEKDMLNRPGYSPIG